MILVGKRETFISILLLHHNLRLGFLTFQIAKFRHYFLQYPKLLFQDVYKRQGGKYSVMGVNIENTARHPSAIGVAVNVVCCSHRRGHIVFDKDLNYKITTHTGVEL